MVVFSNGPFYLVRKAALTSAIVSCFLVGSAARSSVIVSSGESQNINCTAGICTPTAKNAVLSVTDLTAMLAGGDVTIASGSLAKDIEIAAALSWTSTQRLTLDAYRSITFKKPVVVAGTGALTITTDDGGTAGDFQFVKTGHVEFWDLHSNLVINGDHYFLVNSFKSVRRALRNGEATGLHFAQPKNWGLGGSENRTSPVGKYFNGTFEGLGNKISGMTIDDLGSDTGHVGLFIFFDHDAIVRDVTLLAVSITGRGGDFGALTGANAGKIINCRATGQIAPNTFNASLVGGLVGINTGTILRSSADVSILASDGTLYAGGLVGHNIQAVGGYPGIVQDSYATGAVTGSAAAGGLIGQADGGIISNSYATGAVSGDASAAAGGLIGLNAPGEEANSSIANSYSTGAVSGGEGAMLGGSIGNDTVQSGISNVYWDLDTSGISDPAKGAGNASNDPGITGLTTTQFKSGLPVGFDKKVWREKANTNGGYPYLIDLPPK